MVGYYWNRFEKTGDIQDYLQYACASEEKQTQGRCMIQGSETRHRQENTVREGMEQYEQGELIGNRVVSDFRWRV